MAQAQKKIVPDTQKKQQKLGKYMLDKMDATRIARHLIMFEPTESVVEDLVAKARASIPSLAKTTDVLNVFRYNQNCVFAVARKSRFDAAAPVGEALIAILPLNMLGLQHLALGTLNAATPDTRLLVKPNERPAGIYLWCVFAPGPLAASMALLMERLSSDQYIGVNIYARPATDDGRRFSEILGFTRGIAIGQIKAPDVWVFSRRPQLPLYDSYIPHAGTNEIGITIARSFDDLNRVVAIRSAVYIGEQECPYDEEYDGNDLAATHLIAYIGDEPAGCLRLRFFADFAKFERMAIRKEFRKSRAAFQLMRAGLSLCQKKGYRRAYGHSQARLVSFWGRFGFHTFEGGQNFVFSDFDYVELINEIDRDPEAITIGTDPYVIIRPEGRWNRPGILEQSATRAVTRPSIGKRHPAA